MKLDPGSTALIAVHYQGDVVGADGAFADLFHVQVKERDLLNVTARVLTAARAAGATVVYTRVAFAPDYSDMVANSPLLAMTAKAGCLKDGSSLAEIVDAVAPVDDDTVITHKRVSGFIESGLHELLQSRGVGTVLIMGVATNASVESTARSASDLGYRTVMVEDACSCATLEAHQASIASLSLLAEIVTFADVVAALDVSRVGTARGASLSGTTTRREKGTAMADPRGDVRVALATMQARCVIRGIDLSDFQQLSAKVASWDDWWDQWTAMGEHYLALADRYRAEGWPESSGSARLRAGLAFHFGKSMAVEDDARYRELTNRSVEAVTTGLQLLDPTFERIEAPFDGRQVVGNLRRPRGVERPPLALLVPGTDSVKEEFPCWEEEFLRRGIATLTMDGPGQGEVGFELRIRHDYERPVAALLDAVTGRNDLDLSRIAAAGVSLGGYYAIRAAAFEPRITAVLANCGPWSLGDAWSQFSPLYLAKYTWNIGGGSPETARQRAERITLDGVAERIVVPALVIFGTADVLLDADLHGRRTAGAMPTAELWMFEGGNHSVTNFAAEHLGPGADWLLTHM